jgi:inner membrane protein
VDTLTHALSGALLARATAPAPAAAKIPTAARIAAGFVAAAFPDIDFVLSYVSPVGYLTGHRGVTHSLFLLPVWAFALAWLASKIDRRGRASWRDYFGVCALGIAAHIAGDLITSFGTMIYAPFSDARIAWNTTFIIDLWFSGIILAGLAASLVWRRSRAPALVSLAALAGYVGLQALLHSRAVGFGAEYAQRAGFAAPRVEAIPRPVSPFNWMVVVVEGDRYHLANVNLVRTAMPPPPGPDTGFFARHDAPYAPLALANWISVDKYGPDPGSRELAARVFAQPALRFFRWFADFPALYRIERGNPSTCVWFEDLRFVTAGSDRNIFRYGMCHEDGVEDWRAYRLRGDGVREPVGSG